MGAIAALRGGLLALLLTWSGVCQSKSDELATLVAEYKATGSQLDVLRVAAHLCQTEEMRRKGFRLLTASRKQSPKQPYAPRSLIERVERECDPGVNPIPTRDTHAGPTNSTRASSGANLKSFRQSVTARAEKKVRRIRPLGAGVQPIERTSFSWPFIEGERKSQIADAKKQGARISQELFRRKDYIASAQGSSLVLVAPGFGWKEGQQVHNRLERFYSFLIQHYDTIQPRYITTVFLADAWKKGQAVDEIAKKLHRLELPNNAVSFLGPEGETVIAASSLNPGQPSRYKSQGLGSFRHELVHALLRVDFPTAPSWLEEGLAALYEVAQVQGSGSHRRIVGGKNTWRYEHFQAFPNQEPTVAALLSMTRTKFDAVSGEFLDPRQQAVNHSTAWLLVKFLQDRGVLSSTYQCLRARAASQKKGLSLSELEHLTGTENLQERFSHWTRSNLQGAGSGVAGACDVSESVDLDAIVDSLKYPDPG